MRRRALVVALTVSLLLGLAPAANAAVTIAAAPQRSRCQGQLFNYAIRWNGRGSAAYKVEVLKPPRYGFRMTARYDRGYAGWSWGRKRVKRYTTKAAQLGVYQTTVSKRNLRGTRWVKRVYRTRVRDCR
ncbi:hypothetical protein BH20ACT9_BH20ACT9_23990 [soil metagenome]